MEDEKSSSATARQQIMASSSSSSTLFCYPGDMTHPNMTHTQLVSSSTHMIHSSSFESNPENNIYNNLASGIEMIGFSKTNNPTNDNNPNPVLWKGGDDPGKDPDGFYRAGPGDDDGDDGGGGYHDVVVEEEPSMRTCVFPCEGNERPSQGLSLSLSSNNPSTIGLQSFELRVHPQNPPHHHPHHHHHHHHRDYDHHNHDGYFPGKAGQNVVATHMGGGMSSITMQLEMMRSSKYLGPTQELLNEFCSLEDKKSCDDPQGKRQAKKKVKEHWEFLDGDNNHHHHEDDDDNNNHGGDGNEQGGPSSSSQSNLYGLSLLDLQKRKSKLLGLLEELDRRYRHYCEQMKGVVGSFEGMAGPGSANVYTALASKAMSRHFKSLRDAIVGQIKATKKAMGEKESVPGTTRGETPRLRILDQALRQQRAYQQMTMMEAHPWRPQRGLPERSVSILRAWLFEHFLHPYPSDVDKHILARQTGLSRSQVSNWFINARVRLWKPMVEQMYLEETKEEQEKNNMGSSSDAADHHHHHHNQSNDQIAIGGLMQPNLNDLKPTPDQLLRVEAESLSSIINSTTTAKSDRNHAQNPNELGFTNHHHHNLHQSSHFGRVEAPFGSIDIDFPSSSSFHHQHQHHGPPYGGENDNHTPHQGFGLGGSNGAGGGGNVSLTLGLQQHGGNGVTLAFSPTSQSSLFYGRDHDHDQINDCQPVHQYSLLDGDQGQNLPYRNLMGAQLLHDFA